jgi:chromosome segregation ATPase
MFNFLKKKKEGEETAPESEEATDDGQKEAPKEKPVSEGINSPELVKLATEIDKLKASQEAFAEVRKSFTERFTRTSEQIGELRSMILDRDRTIQEIELKAIKASDLVQSVQPEKLMTGVQKQDVKIEALKANIEGNEAITSRVMEELREVRKKVEFFRGIEEIIKLSEEVKKELIEIKKIEGTINIQADKIQTIYGEMRTKLQRLDSFNSELQETKAFVDQSSKDLDFLKRKVSGLPEKTEIDNLVSKVQAYSDSLKELKNKSSLAKDIDQLKIIMENLK